MFAEFDVSSDRSAAILAAAFVQNTLRNALIWHFPNRNQITIDAMMERDGALSTFFGKIHLACAMGLITESVVSDLEIIRRIRNAFAHTMVPLDFTFPEVAAECAKLSLANRDDFDPNRDGRGDDGKSPHSTQRNIYVLACTEIAMNLLVLAGSVSDPKGFVEWQAATGMVPGDIRILSE